jgi:hypothetical protein
MPFNGDLHLVEKGLGIYQERRIRGLRDFSHLFKHTQDFSGFDY